MGSKKEVTIYDLARELNISPSTVSRALKGHFSIGKNTTREVKELADKLGYRPNGLAVSLRNSKTYVIGVVISWVNRPFIASLISGVEEAASNAGYRVIIAQSHDSYKNEVESVQALFDSRVSGLVVSLAMETKKYNHFEKFLRHDIPVVFVDRVTDEINCHRVIIDNFQAGFTATEHLIEQGCRRIAHFAGAQHRNIYKERMRGYIEALKKHNLTVDESLIIRFNNLSMEEGKKGSNHLLGLPNPPDGIFSSNDTAAVSAIQCAKERGIKVPEELAVIGFNNDPISEIIDPSLSTITHPAIDMGKIAAKQVLKHMDQEDIVESETVVLKTQLIVRASSLRKKPVLVY